MPRFAANLTMLFKEVSFLDRFEAATEAGFTGIEYLFPYEFDVDALVTRLRRFGLRQVLHNLPAGDWAKGERGIACLPGREDEFRAGVEQAIAFDLTQPDIGVPVVKIVVPGLEGFDHHPSWYAPGSRARSSR